MCRPMPSGVSALSGLVANGHQAIHHVSSSLSEIPYGGFSPVRLQAGRRWPPSSLRTYRHTQVLPVLAHHSPEGQSPLCVGVEARSVRTLRPRGPWLGVGLFCPVASSLTMASSELLARSRRLICFAGWSLPLGRWPEGPCFKLRILLVVPLPVPRRTRRPEDDCTSARVSLRPNARGSASASFPLESVHVGCPFEAAEFASCCGPTSCLPFTDKDVYIRAFIP